MDEEITKLLILTAAAYTMFTLAISRNKVRNNDPSNRSQFIYF